MPKTRFIYLILFSAGTILCSFCARVGNPTGGPRDKTPPVLVSAEPQNYSVLFGAKTITLGFDEFIKLDNINQKLVVSPPLNERPDIRLRGKNILIVLNGTLKENTTYTFNFGDAISDNNEGNILENFSYVFSTGDKLDSLAAGGKVVDAFSLTPPEETYVALYDNLRDSAPLLEKPLYISKIDKKGSFVLQNLKQDTFRLIGLEDANGNFLYDPGVDKIGFLDTLVILTPAVFSPIHVSDTSGTEVNDTTNSEKNTNKINTIPGPSFYLRLFLEEVENQYLKSVERPNNRFFYLIFNQPVKGRVTLRLLEDTSRTSWFIPEKFVVGDTLGFWLTDTTVINKEKPEVLLSFPSLDSAGSRITLTDTIALEVKNQPPKKPSRNKTSSTGTAEETKAVLNSSASSRRPLELNVPLLLFSATPVSAWDTSLISLYRIQDSLRFSQRFTITPDPFHLRHYRLSAAWQPDTKYLLDLYPGAVTDIYDATNDSVMINFQTRKIEEYGNLTMIINNAEIEGQTIIELLDDKNNVVRSHTITADSSISFLYLKPAKYRVKAILDENSNGKWDTGNFLLHQQPEKVSFFSKNINIRANWDVEETWTIRYKQ